MLPTLAFERSMVALPLDVPLWWFITALSLAALILGIAKSGFGGGLGIIAVPLVASCLRVDHAVGVMLPILIVADLVAAWQHRQHWSRRHVRDTVTGALFGIIVGTWALWSMQAAGQLIPMLNGVIGGICLFFVFLQIWRLRGGWVPRLPDNSTAAVSSGFLCGVVSTVSHSAGPIMSVFLLEHGMAKRVLVATLVIFFFVVNLAKIPTYGCLGLITVETLKTSLIFFPLVPIGAVVGLWMHQRIQEGPFVAIMYVGAAAAGAHMIYKALA